MKWDAVVIGSGSAGLVAAVALARAGQRVLVLEQHYLPGGWTQSFSLGGYRFSPGVHYIGELGPNEGVRRMYEGLGVGDDLEFCELNPHGYDHFFVGGERFDVPKGFDAYFARLCSRFPREREGLRRYFDVVSTVVRDVLECEERLTFPAVLTVPFRAPSLLRWGFSTLQALLDATIQDPLLRGILSAQCGNHGLPPSQVSLPLHARMITHYYEGAYYPRGGAKRIANALVRQLRKHAGKIRLRARVERIVVEGGRAIGVDLEGGERIEAANVISNADPAVTFGKLLAEPHGARERRAVGRMKYSTSLASLFCAVDLDVARLGCDSGNMWWYRTQDVGGAYERMLTKAPGEQVDALFVTVTTLKDPGHSRAGHHVLEMFTFVPYEPFSRWATTSSGARGAEYDSLKERMGDRMLAAADHVIPGVSKAVVFREVGTPLTNDFFCASFRGAAYGTAKTPWQLGPLSFPIRSSVPHLYSVGASTISHGVAGAATSGLMAVQHILGLRHWHDALGPADGRIRIYPADRPEAWAQINGVSDAEPPSLDEVA